MKLRTRAKSSAPDLVRKHPETFSLTLAQRIARGWRLRCSFSGIVGIGNAPIPRKSQDVILEVAEALQKTPEFAFGLGTAFSGSALRNGIGGKPLVDQFVVAFELYCQFLLRKGFHFGILR